MAGIPVSLFTLMDPVVHCRPKRLGAATGSSRMYVLRRFALRLQTIATALRQSSQSWRERVHDNHWVRRLMTDDPRR
jgi:hypothetical protein